MKYKRQICNRRCQYSEPVPPASPIGSDEEKAEYFRALMKTLWIQAVLLTGCAFVGLTALSYPPASPRVLVSALGMSASLTAALELLVMFVAGLLACLPKQVIIKDEYARFSTVAFLSHYAGMTAFLVSVALVCWIKFRPVALPVSGIVALIGSGMVFCLYRMAMAAEQFNREEE